MRNVYNELNLVLNHLRSEVEGIKLVAAELVLLDSDYNETVYTLPKNYSPEQVKKFLSTLAELNYDEGFGTQYLFGTVWLSNGYWLTRGEYDGSEW